MITWIALAVLFLFSAGAYSLGRRKLASVMATTEGRPHSLAG